MTAELYVLSRPTFTEDFRDFLLKEECDWIETASAKPAERLIEFAGRVCYMAFGSRQFRTSNAAYIQNLIAQGHESVLEHANWSFLLSGVTRAFTHQLVRHRPGFAYSQLSQQYHDESEARFVPPRGIERSRAAAAAWKDAVEACRRAYRTIIAESDSLALDGTLPKREAARALRSTARSVLPNATETIIVVTANARAIRHFLTVRGAIAGDEEMRVVSRLVYDMIAVDAPSLIGDFQARTRADGSPEVVRISAAGAPAP
jgi:thymidylate synthase (FAD)